MNTEPIAIETALIELYNYTRRASIPLDDHDKCRAYVDVLAQALNIKLEWGVPKTGDQPKQDNTPKQVDLINLAKQAKKK